MREERERGCEGSKQQEEDNTSKGGVIGFTVSLSGRMGTKLQ